MSDVVQVAERADLRILFLEDDPVDAMLIREQLQCGGEHFEITDARSLASALDLLSRERFDLALLDLDVGDSSGSATYYRVNAEHPSLPVVVLTGQYDPQCTAELLQHGAQDCLIKGAAVEQLLPRTIRYAVERNHVRASLTESLRRISQSEMRLRNLINANSDAVLLVDMSGIVRFANRSAERMFGSQPDGLVGAELGRPIGNGIPVEVDIKRADGSQGVAELRVSRTDWQGEEVFLAALRDVTERVEVEQALRRSEQKLIRSERHLETAQRIAGTGSFELDPDTLECGFSDQLRKMLGTKASGRLDWSGFLDRHIPDPMRGDVERAIETARAGNLAERIEIAFVRADGADRKAFLQCDCLPGTPDLPTRVIGVIRDITELREAQARQAKLEEQLRHSQKLEALGTLAGGIAHDLNNTLVPITTVGSILLEAAGDDADQRQCVTLILEAAARAKGLVREVLTFSRQGARERGSVQLDGLVEDTMRMICAGLPAYVRCRIATQPVPPIQGSQGQLYQVVLNLVTNAAQAIGDRPGTITIGVEPNDNGVRLFVEDDGPGMDNETRRRIFDPFFTTKAASEGTGLGLSVVSGIVADHGGKATVLSAIGQGTRFDIHFPLSGTEGEV